MCKLLTMQIGRQFIRRWTADYIYIYILYVDYIIFYYILIIFWRYNVLLHMDFDVLRQLQLQT